MKKQKAEKAFPRVKVCAQTKVLSQSKVSSYFFKRDRSQDEPGGEKVDSKLECEIVEITTSLKCDTDTSQENILRSPAKVNSGKMNKYMGSPMKKTAIRSPKSPRKRTCEKMTSQSSSGKTLGTEFEQSQTSKSNSANRDVRVSPGKVVKNLFLSTIRNHLVSRPVEPKNTTKSPLKTNNGCSPKKVVTKPSPGKLKAQRARSLSPKKTGVVSTSSDLKNQPSEGSVRMKKTVRLSPWKVVTQLSSTARGVSPQKTGMASVDDTDRYRARSPDSNQPKKTTLRQSPWKVESKPNSKPDNCSKIGLKLSPRKLKFSYLLQDSSSESTVSWTIQDLPESAVELPDQGKELKKSGKRPASPPSPPISKHLCSSPRKNLSTPPKKPSSQESPLKSELLQEFSYLDDFFAVEFEDEIKKKDLDLSGSKRCRVLSLESGLEGVIMMVQCLESSLTASCLLLPPWSDAGVAVGDVVVVEGVMRDSQWEVGPEGRLVMHSDMLVSGTAVVGSLFCQRRSVLSSLLKEGPASTGQAAAMRLGIAVHDILQQCLREGARGSARVGAVAGRVLSQRDVIVSSVLSGSDIKELSGSVSAYLPNIVDFIDKYVTPRPPAAPLKTQSSKDGEFVGEIVEVKDIEENIWCPGLGIKGRIDVTVAVRAKRFPKTKVMPLELKTGKASFSAEHRGQVILYVMMLQHLGLDVDSGLLLYLKQGVMREVGGRAAERRDLLMLRNQLVCRLVEASKAVPPIVPLPPPIRHHSACASCPALIPCASALRQCGTELGDRHPLGALVSSATSHLSDAHLEYIFTFLCLLMMEARAQPPQPIWALATQTREEEGKCVSDLNVVKVEPKGSRFLVTLSHKDDRQITQGVVSVGQFVVVSSRARLAVSLGTITSVSRSSLQVNLDRDLSEVSGPLLVDRYESGSSTRLITPFLGLLMQDSAQAAALRAHIIDLKLPKFAEKLSSQVKKAGAGVFAQLNRQQVRVILQVLSAESYIIVKGLPGTGKSRTVAGLVELCCILGLSVLLCSHTHSAVDTVLCRLPPKLLETQVLRLGQPTRVAPALARFTEQALLASLPSSPTTAQVQNLYDSRSIYGVTCMGASHEVVCRRKFDVCVVDEASQVCQPEAMAALLAAKKFVLVGDPLQLPPLVISSQAKDAGLGVSLLERLDRPAVSTSLTVQYRMNSRIARLANHLTYSGQLSCADDTVASATIPSEKGYVDGWLGRVTSPLLEDSVVLVDSREETDDGASTNAPVNNHEAALVVSIVTALIERGVKGEDIGVMSPYRGQVELLERRLNKGDLSSVEVSTVDQFQGRDKSAVIFSACRTKPKAAGGDILGDGNRLTVAITRAKHKLVLVGSLQVLSTYSIFVKLLTDIDPPHIIKP